MKGSVFSSRASSPSHQTPSPPPRAHHTFSENIMEENIDYAETVIRRWDIDTQKYSPLFVDDRREAKRFIEAVTGLQQAMLYYSKIRSSSDVLVRAQNLMQIAVNRLEKEFYVILSANRRNLDSESVSSRSSRASARSSVSDFNEDEVSEEEETSTTPSRTPPRGGNSTSAADRASDTAMADLKMIADCMISYGYAKECVNIYKLIRKSIIDETLYYLGVEKLNYSQMQKMDWSVLEPKIKIWLHAVKVAVKTLFSGERILCDEVFSSSEKIAESCFTDISKDAAVNLFFFPENFGKSKKILAPEKMFRALDQFEAISDLWPEIESVFSHDSLSPVRLAAEAALVKLGEAVRTMLVQFEAAIQKDSSKTSIGGGVHPLTRYVMNYLIFLGDYCGSIAVIVTDWSVGAQSPLPESYFASPLAGEDPMAADLSARLAWLILVLLCKLDGKAVMYNDVALAYLFLANNLNYVVSKIRNSSLGLVMGSDWISDTQSKVDKYFGNYERMGWSKVLSSLPEDPTADISPQDSMECFRRFNLNFEEAYKKQTSWVIPDPKWRDEIKISLARKIVPSYREFYQKHRANYARRMGVESIVRYAPEDLNNYLSDLFFAGGGTSSHLTYPESPMSTRGR